MGLRQLAAGAEVIPTVQKAMRPSEPPEPETLNVWARRELLPFLVQVRQALNYICRQQAAQTTQATATPTTIWSSADLAIGTAVRIDAFIVAYGTIDRSAFNITGLFYNNGTTAQEGVTFAAYTQNAGGGFAVQFVVVSNHVELQVQDDGVSVVDWNAVIDAQVAP